MNPPPPACRGHGVPDAFADLSILTFLQTPKPFQGLRLCRRPYRWRFSFRTPAPFFRIFFHFFAAQQFIKKRTSIKPSQNLTNRTHERPKLDFGAVWVAFWHPFCDHFSYLFSKCENSVFEQQYKTLAPFRPPETSPFRIDFRSKINVFPGHTPGHRFSSFYVDLC